MNILKYIKTGAIIVFSASILTAGTVNIQNAYAQTELQTKPVQTQQNVQQCIQVAPLTVVKNPKAYLNKNVTMTAKFDKFSTLGLDYKPAYKSSEDYISFLVKRDDTSYNIPLSEMKLFLKRETAEKFIDLKSGDKIQIKGLVFSDALGDAWINVTEVSVIEKAPDIKK